MSGVQFEAIDAVWGGLCKTMDQKMKHVQKPCFEATPRNDFALLKRHTKDFTQANQPSHFLQPKPRGKAP